MSEAEPVDGDTLYQSYAEMRSAGRVHSRRFEGRLRFTLVHYDDVASGLRDPRLRSMATPGEIVAGLVASGVPELVNLARIEPNSLAFKDPPDHTRLRGELSRVFTPRSVLKLRPGIRSLVSRLVAGLRSQGSVDLVNRFAAPLSVLVIANLVGIPPADRHRLKRWSDDMVPLMDRSSGGRGFLQAADSLMEFTGYLRWLMQERSREPRPDLLSALLLRSQRGRGMSEVEILATVVLLFGAGHETTTSLIANGTYSLLKNPEEMRRLRDDPELATSAVDEMLRYESPLQHVPRIADEDIEHDGTSIPAGAEVFLSIGAANRDPKRFPDPDRFDVGRVDNAHIAFGGGPHFCLGAALSRLEATDAITALVRELPSLRLDGGEPGWRSGLFLRRLRSLPVRF